MEVCVKASKKSSRHPLFSLLFGAIILGLVMSACTSQSGTITNTNNSSQNSPQGNVAAQPAGVTPTQTTHPIASQPPGAKKGTGGTPLPANEVKPLTFNLAYNDASIEHDILQMYIPGSATFHQFLTPNQFVQRYALSNAQLQLVKNWLTSQHYTIVSVDGLRSSIQVTGTVATIESSLNIQLKAYTLLNRTFFMQEGDPKLPASVSPYVQSVVGLNNFAFPEFKPPIGFSLNTQLVNNTNCKGYGAKQTLTRDKLAGAYQINKLYTQGFQGQGMNVGIAEFDEPFSASDIANYAACAGIAVPKITNIAIDGSVKPGPGEGEAAMDVELVAGLAPKANILVYQASTDNTSFVQAMVDLLNRVATDHQVQVLSISYGTAESNFSSTEMDAINRSLRTLAAEGISVFISSGDCGAYTLRIRQPQIAEVAFPASAPYAIAVGGTHLQVNNNNARTSETVWGDDDGAPICQNEWGSGGGVSQNPDFKRPSWQVGKGTTTQYDGTSQGVFIATLPPEPLKAPNGLRQVPDVAAAAFPNIAIYYNGAWYASGGTSAAAPIWAAGATLVNQAMQQNGKSLLGGVPEFYTLANNPKTFHPYTDITSGNNLYYSATPGWDYTTGWGSPGFYDITQMELS
jgi:kumamolisin